MQKNNILIKILGTTKKITTAKTSKRVIFENYCQVNKIIYECRRCVQLNIKKNM